MRSKRAWAREHRAKTRDAKRLAETALAKALTTPQVDPGAWIEAALRNGDVEHSMRWFAWAGGAILGESWHDPTAGFLSAFQRLYGVLRREALIEYMGSPVDTKCSPGDQRISPLWFFVAVTPWHRELEAWRPKGAKSREAKVEHLLRHLFGRYPVPRWLVPPDARGGTHVLPLGDALRLYVWLTSGGSVMGAVQDGLIPVPFTKRMAHEFLMARADNPVEASRLAAATVHGLGAPKSGIVRQVVVSWERWETPARERFIDEVISWLARQGMVAPEQVRPLKDYLDNCWHHTFSMKGRTATALIRQMEAWHRETAQAKGNGRDNKEPFVPSGFKGFVHVKHFRNPAVSLPEVWAIDEVLTPVDLRAEAAVMRHCVGSYGGVIRAGRVSIWRLRKGFGPPGFVSTWEPVVTIEVRNTERRIVQARGKFNVVPDAKALSVLAGWARDAGLTVSPHL